MGLEDNELVVKWTEADRNQMVTFKTYGRGSTSPSAYSRGLGGPSLGLPPRMEDLVHFSQEIHSQDWFLQQDCPFGDQLLSDWDFRKSGNEDDLHFRMQRPQPRHHGWPAPFREHDITDD